MRVLLALLPLPLFAACDTVVREPGSDTAETQSAESTAPDMNAAQRGYAKANERMHKGMGHIDPDADVAFIQGMIPHHQGAVDMANVILEHGDDEEAKKLARGIITAQEEEIAWMRNWLKERGLGENASAAANHSAAGH